MLSHWDLREKCPHLGVQQGSQSIYSNTLNHRYTQFKPLRFMIHLIGNVKLLDQIANMNNSIVILIYTEQLLDAHTMGPLQRHSRIIRCSHLKDLQNVLDEEKNV